MTDATTATTGPSPGLLTRIVGVIVSPQKTYEAVAARPRALGALAVPVLLMILCQGLFLSTDIGKRALLDQQVKSMEAFGVNVTDQMYQQMQSRLAIAPYTTAVWQLVFVPVAAAVVAGLLYFVFNALMGGNATYKHVYAVVAHSCILIALQQVFSTPISYARGEFTNATSLAVFLPMLEEESVPAMFLRSIDLFMIWWFINLAIGMGVLYKRRSGGIAWALLGVYIAIAAAVTTIRTVL